MTLETFIYNTTKPGTNELTSTDFYVKGVKRKLSTKGKIKEGMNLKLNMIMICRVTGRKYESDYENFKWNPIN